jgi:ATP-dependent DNA helicase PIF1
MTNYDITEEMLSTEQSYSLDREVPCEFICGPAGVGKTFGVVKAVAADSSYGVLSSTTGISAVNLGAITVHSLLRYSTTQVLRDHFLTGRLVRILHSLAKRARRLIVDEMSMGSADQLDLWYRGVQEANRYSDVTEPLGITLVADFAQLPPVNERWCFEAGCWERFAARTTKLTKVWRQGAGPFLDALNLIRRGEGAAGAEVLARAGARFETALDTEFEGTTILPKNDQVGRYNAMALDRVPGAAFRVTSRRWGQQRSEWGQSTRTREWGIPPEVELREGAYVMLLSNAPDFEYVNGDCGQIYEHYTTPEGEERIAIVLVRTDKVVVIAPLVRSVEYTDRPDGWSGVSLPKSEDDGGWFPRPHYRGRVKRYVTGQIEYFPLRLAYASTVHKTQSLTLDRVQVDIRNGFFGQPGMCYTGLSRVRTLEGLRIVGQKEVLAKRVSIDERIRPWL